LAVGRIEKYMKNIFQSLILFGLSLVVLGCASGHCRGRKVANLSGQTVLVYKSNAEVQCKKNSAIPLDKMAKTLEGISVVSAQKKGDGKMRMTVCGASSGQLNVYEIPAEDFEKARSLGFEAYNLEDNNR